MSDDKKLYHALLNGLCQRLYFGDETMTAEFLKGELYSEMPEEEFQMLHKSAERLLTNIVSSDMDFAKLERFLGAQAAKKTEGALTEEQAQAFAKFWKAQRSKVQERLSELSCWEKKLAAVSWRVDVKTKSRHIEELNDATGILELKLDQGSGKSAEVVQVEVDRTQLNTLLREVAAIEQELKATV
eukprot:m.10649 g.10649  ORF g.10649 m.10649 type:complete len:186 (-) comp6030_c0_seq1:23-580(-)